MNLNLDDIKQQWQQANAPLSALTDDTVRLSRRALLRRGSAQDKLAAQYRRMIILSGVGFVLWVTSIFLIDVAAWACPWLIVASAVFFATSGGLDLYLYRAVRRIDLASWPVSDVALEGRRLLRFHKFCILLLLPMAFGLLFFLVCTIDAPAEERQGILWGMAVGGAIGLCAGVAILLRFLRLYRTLTDDLK